MATEMDGFLKAEESANILLSNLERLKDEIEGYSRAKNNLENVRVQLVALVQALGRTAEQSTSVMAALERIGTPEILKEIGNVVVLNDKSVAAVDELGRVVSEALPKMGSKLENTIAANSELLNAASSATQNQLSEHVGALKQQVELVAKSLTNDITQMSQKMEQQGKSLKLMIGIGLPLVAIVASIVVFLMKGR